MNSNNIPQNNLVKPLHTTNKIDNVYLELNKDCGDQTIKELKERYEDMKKLYVYRVK
jgi:hypothetical protein